MAYTVRISTRFKKDFKRCMKRGLNMKLITDAMDLLEATGTLPAEYKPHLLKGDRKGQVLMRTSSAGNIFLLTSDI